jgi:hypothetical protein
MKRGIRRWDLFRVEGILGTMRVSLPLRSKMRLRLEGIKGRGEFPSVLFVLPVPFVSSFLFRINL